MDHGGSIVENAGHARRSIVGAVGAGAGFPVVDQAKRVSYPPGPGGLLEACAGHAVEEHAAGRCGGRRA